MDYTNAELPPRPIKGTGLPAAWMDPAGGKYLHYYDADANTSRCARWRSTELTRAAWLRRDTVNKLRCPSCQRSAEPLLGWVYGIHI
jgi:hypothetical protein